MVNTDKTVKNKQNINNTAEEIFNGQGRFDPVDRRPAKRYYNDKDKDDFIPKPVEKKEVRHLDKGIKFGRGYIRRGKLYFWVVFSLLVLVLAILFLPPFMSSIPDETEVLYGQNVFESMGMTDFKSYAMSNYSVYNEEAFASEKSDSYRVVSLRVHLQNVSSFELKIPQFKVVSVPKKYEKALCYVTSETARKATDKEHEGDVVKSFGVEDVTVEIMVNVTDMTDEEFDELITGMVIRTEGAKRRIAGKFYLPCLPSVLKISDNTEVSINP